MKKRIIAAVVAALMALLSVGSALPVLAKTEKPVTKYETPSGYNDHDYQKLVAFLEIEDPNGEKNGYKLCGDDYSPANPGAWQWAAAGDNGVYWRLDYYDGIYERRVLSIDFSNYDPVSEPYYNMVGDLDLSGFEYINTITVFNNDIESIDVSGCSRLTSLSCWGNPISALDLSDNPSLILLNCSSCSIIELDLSNNPLLYFERISSEGNGTVGFSSEYDVHDDLVHMAFADWETDGSVFLGWYSEDGTFISGNHWLYEYETDFRCVVAKYSNEQLYIPGDCDGDGEVDTTDALLVMRCALGISGDADEMLANCDMDGDGTINTTDALLILRTALGIL